AIARSSAMQATTPATPAPISSSRRRASGLVARTTAALSSTPPRFGLTAVQDRSFGIQMSTGLTNSGVAGAERSAADRGGWSWAQEATRFDCSGPVIEPNVDQAYRT